MLTCMRAAICRAAGGGNALAAKDALGNDVKKSSWLKTHPAGDRSLVQGLKSDATYLIGAPSHPPFFGFWLPSQHAACMLDDDKDE